jgi:hypothetical protein
MEQEFFRWDDWDALDNSMLIYYGCELVAPIGEHAVGEVFSSIVIDYDRGILELKTNSGIERFKLKLQLGNKIENLGIGRVEEG